MMLYTGLDKTTVFQCLYMIPQPIQAGVMGKGIRSSME
jgi:hypothetical protein